MSERGVGTSDLIGLRQVAADHVYPHVFENADREVGGVLVGRTPRDGGLPLITGAIPALQADEQRATLTFTQDAWEHVHRTLDAAFPADEQIVGWYHSHPGFGIFLSEHDLFIHRNFFSGPSQIALVVDPHGCTEGVFTWTAGEVALLFERPTPSGWHAVQPPWQPPAVARPAVLAPPERQHSALALGLIALLGLGTGFGVERVLVGPGTPPASTVTRPASARPRHRQLVPTTPAPPAQSSPGAPRQSTNAPGMTVENANPYAQGQAQIEQAR